MQTATGPFQPTIDIRRSGERFATRVDWLDSRHSFSFNRHYDPNNTHFALLLVSNDDVVRPGTGFSTHPHQDMEIVTWVLDGKLEHQNSEGHAGEIYPGLAQRMSAGTGIWHSEMNATPGGDVHFVQMWVVPDEQRIRPGYQHLEIGHELARGGLVPVASGRGNRLGNPDPPAARHPLGREAEAGRSRLDPCRAVRAPLRRSR